MRTTAATYLPLGKFCASDAAASNASSERRDRCDPGPALRCYLHAGGQSTRCLHLYFCLACLVSYRPLAKLRPIPSNLFAPGLCARAGTSPRAFPVSLRLRCLCFAWRLPAEGKYSDGFTT